MTEQELDGLLRSLGVHPDCFDAETVLAAVRAEMEDGLAGHAHGMLMLPTYLSAGGFVPKGEPLTVIDAGGTSLRTALARFDADGKLILDRFRTQPMPGTRDECSVSEFFDAIADAIQPLVGESTRIGFCFSYPFEALPDSEGRLIRFCKEIRVRDSRDILICDALRRALRRKGILAEKRIVLLNDSVAALLGGLSVCPDGAAAQVGLILGTGLNLCYSERTDAVRTAGKTDLRTMIVNTEAGSCRAFPAGTVDRLLDAGTENPGDSRFEKMVSGGYLGRVMALTAQLCAEHGAFSAEGAARLREISAFSLADVGAFSDGAAMFGLSAPDAAVLRQIVRCCFARAAKLTLLMLGAVLLKTGFGRDPAQPVCVTAEGTTFRKAAYFRKRFFRGCDEFLRGKLGLHVRILECENAVLAGTAVAGLQAR